MSEEKKTPTPSEASPVPETEEEPLEIRSPSKLAALTKRKWIVVGLIGFLAASMFGSFMAPEVKPPSIKEKTVVVNTTPEDLGRKNWQVQAQAEIAKMRKELEEVSRQNQQLSENLKKVTEEAREYEGKVRSLKSEMEKIKTQKPVSSNGAPVPPPAKGEAPKGETEKVAARDAASELDRLSPPTFPGKSVTTGKAVKRKPAKDKPLVFSVAKSKKSGDRVKTKVRYRKNKSAGLLPAGSFVRTVLLSGVDAGASESARENPWPVVLRIQDNAILPGGARYKLKGCFLLGSAYGNISAERVEVRLSDLSCVDKRRHLVLTSPVKGYVVDNDSSIGLRGKVERRNGAYLFNSLLAGWASGMASAFGLGTRSLGFGGGVGVQTIGASQALQLSGFSGAQTAMDNLAQYYIDEASNIFPIISVAAGRKGGVYFSDSVSLRWKDYGSLYIKEVVPESK